MLEDLWIIQKRRQLWRTHKYRNMMKMNFIILADLDWIWAPPCNLTISLIVNVPMHIIGSNNTRAIKNATLYFWKGQNRVSNICSRWREILKLLTRELTEICITSRVQKVWVVEFVNGPNEIPQWPFLSVPVRAFGKGVCPKLHPKTV